MATSNTENLTPPAPRLIEPREMAVVDGNAVRFVWEPVEEAVSYQLEVARDPEFQEIIFEEVLDRRTSLTVANVFPIDEQTYFWRVLACDGTNWSTGEHVESFVSCSRERSCQPVAAPDAEETFGPVGRLVTSSTVVAAGEVTQSEKLKSKEQQLGAEHDRIEAGQILGLAASVLMALVIIIVVMVQWMGVRSEQARLAVASRQTYPELRELRAQAEQKLTQYGVASDTSGTYTIPIDRAMDLVIQQSRQGGNASVTQELPLSPNP